jgi:Na+/H+ antiporter NhaD/arsenite permease-like protein
VDVFLACAVFVVTYALIATERIHRVTAAIGGVALMTLVGVPTLQRPSARSTVGSTGT